MGEGAAMVILNFSSFMTSLHEITFKICQEEGKTSEKLEKKSHDYHEENKSSSSLAWAKVQKQHVNIRYISTPQN